MRISIFHDEIDPADPARAIRLAAEWGVTHLEVRSLPTGRFPQPQDPELETFYARIRDAGLAVSGVSPGFCKCPLDDPSVPRFLEEGLPRACEWARRMDTDRVSGFAFRKRDADRMPDEVVDRVAQMAAITAQHGCRLSLENEAGCWGATGLEAAAIIRQVGSEHLQLCWDPGNSARAGSAHPHPDEYEQLKDLVAHVHAKNVDPRDNSWQLVEQGVVDWRGQLTALQGAGYEGFIVIETHLYSLPDGVDSAGDLCGREAATYRNLEFVRSCLAPA